MNVRHLNSVQKDDEDMNLVALLMVEMLTFHVQDTTI